VSQYFIWKLIELWPVFDFYNICHFFPFRILYKISILKKGLEQGLKSIENFCQVIGPIAWAWKVEDIIDFWDTLVYFSHDFQKKKGKKSPPTIFRKMLH